METRERTKADAGEQRWYASAARPPTPGEMTKAEPADAAKAEPENADAGAGGRGLRWIVGIYVVTAAVMLALGRGFDSVYWASIAFFFAVSLQPRERVPKPLRYFAVAVVLALSVVKVTLLLLELKVI